MGIPYTTTAISAYNAAPPPDDNSQIAANQVKWATIKSKITDPLKDAIESVNTEVATSFALVLPNPGHLYGLTLSNNGTDATNDIDIAVGEATSNDALAADRVLMSLTSALTKRLDSGWVVGTGEGMLDTGSVANGTYHIFLIQRPDTGVEDVLASTSATAPTMPTNYTKARRIGSIMREGAVNVPFVQDGDYFQRKVAAGDTNATNPGTSAVTATLSVPTGLKVRAQLNLFLASTTANSNLSVSDPETTDAAPSTPGRTQLIAGTDGVSTTCESWVRTNTSAQVRYRVDVSNANTVVRIGTLGWMDTRGR